MYSACVFTFILESKESFPFVTDCEKQFNSTETVQLENNNSTTTEDRVCAVRRSLFTQSRWSLCNGHSHHRGAVGS